MSSRSAKKALHSPFASTRLCNVNFFLLVFPIVVMTWDHRLYEGDILTKGCSLGYNKVHLLAPSDRV
jgi:hypothetical protein